MTTEVEGPAPDAAGGGAQEGESRPDGASGRFSERDLFAAYDRGVQDARAERDDERYARRYLEAPPTFAFERFGAMEPAAPAYLIRPLLERNVLAAIYGDPGACKTFLALDAACSLSAGVDFHGHRVEQVPVAYIAAEGRGGLARRRRAWEIRHGVALGDAPLFVSDRGASLMDATNAAAVSDAVDHIADQHGPPGLIVVDTLARNFGPGDENSTADMSRFIQHLDALRYRHDATILLVHHTGHQDKSRARGAMALKGALDAEYRVDRDEAGIVRVVATKMKDAPEPEPMAFHPRTVELGVEDDFGQSVTSAVLDATGYEPATPTGNEGHGRWQHVALEALRALDEEHRARVAADGRDPETARVSVHDWRDRCRGEGMPRSTFYRNKDTLAELGVVRIEHGFVWLLA